MVIVGNYKGVEIDSIKVAGGNNLSDSSGKYTLRVGTNYIFRVRTKQLGNSNLTHNLRDGINIHADDCVALKNTTPKIEANGDYKIYEYQISAIKEGSQKIRFSAESEYVDCNVEVKSGGGGSTNTQGEIKLYKDINMKEEITSGEYKAEGFWVYADIYTDEDPYDLEGVSDNHDVAYVGSIQNTGSTNKAWTKIRINLMFYGSCNITIKNKKTGASRTINLTYGW